jgi:ferric-dicitrate binding protein FerR (iron transport regulator)
MQIKVNAGNAIAYIPQNTNTATEVVYNTLSTVRGQESPYPLVLSDGTKVWLNAESSITYPIAFNGKERSVKITGEAYFEVVHNTVQPFKVEVKGQTIEDIGTAFNINAYDDEPNMKTTLISGSVKINSSTVLHPGQQAIQSGPAIRVKDVDTEGAIAWKNGYFLFDYESLESIMRRISRWYNVDVAYEPGQQITTGFLGSMTRYTNVSEVLNALEAAGKVKFKIEGRKITVSKK